MSKVFSTVLFIMLGYIAPLLPRPELMLHYKIWLLMGGAATIFLTQPALKMEDAKAGQMQDRNSVFLILALSLASAAAPVVEWAYWHPHKHHLWVVLAGLAIIAGGIGLRIWAIRALGAFFTPTVQISQQHQLVQSGPYALVRHPSYLGAFLALLGGAVVLESWAGLAVSCFLMLWVYHFRITLEENALMEAFGETYVAYQSRTYRLIPFIW